jgi:hypothetical protein
MACGSLVEPREVIGCLMCRLADRPTKKAPAVTPPGLKYGWHFTLFALLDAILANFSQMFPKQIQLKKYCWTIEPFIKSDLSSASYREMDNPRVSDDACSGG